MKALLISIVIILSAPTLLPGAVEMPAPNVSMGLSGTLGRYDIYSQNNSSSSKMKWDTGPGYGGGLIFEKMFSNRFGVLSGLHYIDFRLSASEIDSTTGGKARYELRSRGLGMPLYLETSFSSPSVTLSFLAGFSFFHLFDSKITVDSGGATTRGNILIYINENQAALSGGIMIKFRVGAFTDLFVGGIAEYSLMNFFSDNARGGDDEVNYLYNYRGIMGIMVRTNIFPILGK